MAKYSHKLMGKEVGQASTYAEPHTMKGKKINAAGAMKSVSGGKNPNTVAADKVKVSDEAMEVSVGDKTTGVKTTGIKMRGAGAATRGITSRGPMA